MSRASGAPQRERRSINKMHVEGCLTEPCCCLSDCLFWSFPILPFYLIVEGCKHKGCMFRMEYQQSEQILSQEKETIKSQVKHDALWNTVPIVVCSTYNPAYLVCIHTMYTTYTAEINWVVWYSKHTLTHKQEHRDTHAVTLIDSSLVP